MLCRDQYLLFPILVDWVFINKRHKKIKKMPQLTKIHQCKLNLQQDVKKVANPNKRPAPSEIFAQIYGLQRSHTKSDTDKSVENSNFLNSAYRYCMNGIDDTFKQELHYISNKKLNL